MAARADLAIRNSHIQSGSMSNGCVIQYNYNGDCEGNRNDVNGLVKAIKSIFQDF